MRDLRDGDVVAIELPPGTTVTSPLENTTTSETTTSAPPNPEEDEATTAATSTAATATTSTSTSTSTKTKTTTPTTLIPTAPGTLSTTAQTAKVGTVEVDGDDLDVVVKGDTVPADARTALAALDTWINEGTRPSGDWATFTSSDPDSDGWRWATVNQKTGTVVYIR